MYSEENSQKASSIDDTNTSMRMGRWMVGIDRQQKEKTR